MDQQALARCVRDALAHVHDHFYLEAQPLASELSDAGEPLTGVGLRRQLLDAIAGMKPPGSPLPSSVEWRRYRHLVLRYIEGRSQREIERELRISPRQASRDHQQAVDLLATHFWLQVARRHRCSSSDTFDQIHAADRHQPRIAPLPSADPASVHDADPYAALQGATQTLRKLARDRQVRFDLKVPDTLSPVAVDPVTLRHILLHLLTYAIEHRSVGTIEICAANQPEGVLLSIGFDPAGSGSAPAQLVSGRAEGIRDLYEMGRRSLEAHGGTVEVVFRGSGAAFLSIVLPPSRQTTVLVIDDNPDVVELFRRFLRDEPYRLVQATTATSALQLLETLHPDIIILDVVMPLQDGWEILAFLQSTPARKGTPVIICSVLAECALAYSLGAAAFLAKPVTRSSLLSALERWARTPQASQVRP